ncbi:P-loop containing nucleoside triphosphate hydrolase protein, partial [Catenaria anguillulae PL171]
MGANKKPKLAAGDDESGQARSTSASPTPSNSDRSNKHRSSAHATPAPTRRDHDIQAQRMSLPVAEYQADIQRAIRENQVVIIAGETGSGKSTQVPQFVLEDVIASGGTGQVFCTQPRRISATSIATRVASEWGDARVGDTIGYSVKLESKVSSKTRLVFCTTGILLRRLESDPTLQGISHVLVDEVHERSLDSDFLLVMLRRLTATRPDLRIVLMSATMNESQFSAYFDRCPVLSIPGRTFPVERMYLEDVVE